MIKRIITAVVGLLLFFPVMYFSDTYAFDVTISLLSLVGVYEIICCVGMTKDLMITIPICVFALALPLYVGASYKYIYNLSVLFLFYLLFTAVLSKGKYDIEKLAAINTFSIYVVTSFTSLIILRRTDCGQYIIWLVFIGAWITDTFAYFVGKFFGKHKLIPDVSPKKTIEGAVGGVIFCTAAFVLYGIIIQNIYNVEANYLYLALSGTVVSVVSQLGDLVASKIKRHYNIKDFGKILPGHGGILDRFDSIIAVSPFLLIITSRPDIIYLFR